MNTILQVCLPLPRRLQLRWTSVLLFNYFNVQFLNISGPVLGWSSICRKAYLQFYVFWEDLDKCHFCLPTPIKFSKKPSIASVSQF